jgi:Na+/proline symporter
MIMATVTLAACKIAAILFGLSRWQTLLICGLLNVVFAAHSGLWGVLVIDMIQFFVKMTAVIAAAWFAVKHIGGMHMLVSTLSSKAGPGGINYLNILPDFTNNWNVAVAVFIMPIAVQWWAVWYPGAEPGEAATLPSECWLRSRRRTPWARSFFSTWRTMSCDPGPGFSWRFVRYWFTRSSPTSRKPFPISIPLCLGTISLTLRCSNFFPAGFIGLMVGGLIAANSSTILTHLNWGASYLVHDFYRRFINRSASEKHYVWMGRMATVGLFVCAAALTFVLDTAKDAFDIILAIGAGTGLLYLLRWFWWRVNAWCEVVAMVSSFAVSLVLLVLARNGFAVPTHIGLLVTVAMTTICWVATGVCWP